MPSLQKPTGGLDQPIQYLKGIGPRRAGVLAEHGLRTVRDLLHYYPYGYIDLSTVENIAGLRRHEGSDRWITVIGTVRAFDLVGRPPRQRFLVTVGDGSGTLQLVFFQGIRFFRNAFSVGEIIAASGRVTSFSRRLQMIHPSVDHLAAAEEDGGDLHGFLHTGGIVPKYGSSADLRDVNLHVKGLRRIIRSALDQFLPEIKEFLPPALLEGRGYPPLPVALRSVHFPESQAALEAARRRLKFDELFTMQLLLALHRNRLKSETLGISFNVESKLARRLVDGLPFRLTRAQRAVIREIADDMQSPKPMYRLLQGDVGSGKTVVALIAMLIAVENGYQAAFMAPTEILAEQHFGTIASLLGEIDVGMRLLRGGQKASLREDILGDMRSGRAGIVVGTHALIQEGVSFAKLGLVIIDEQHRFGVAQRLALREKGRGWEAGPQPDILVMTATPIPRTLSLTLFGDLDVSTISEMPAGRKPVLTMLKTESHLRSVYEFVRREAGDGRQAYIVYPLVEESEKVDLKAATESYRQLKSEIFPDLRVGLVHGKMSPDEKDRIMSEFKTGKLDILVATTVIEVGVDVPNATMMVIEHAERFGLSQLHQLRGRVGRGGAQSTCILIAPSWLRHAAGSEKFGPMSEGIVDERRIAERRLSTMVGTNDGFKIAEIDLELRGPGDFFGTRQSGIPSLRIANLLTDGDLLETARRDAMELIGRDPHLRLPEHAPLRKEFEERMHDALMMIEGG